MHPSTIRLSQFIAYIPHFPLTFTERPLIIIFFIFKRFLVESVETKKTVAKQAISSIPLEELKGKLLINLRKNGSEALWNLLQTVDIKVVGSILTITTFNDCDQEFLDRIETREKIASKLGFPSANLIYPESKISIPHGVYYVTVEIENQKYNGILNHGFAPTIDNEQQLKTEVHILDFNNDIYGRNIKISSERINNLTHYVINIMYLRIL